MLAARLPRSRNPSWPYELNQAHDHARGLYAWWPGDPAGGGKLWDLGLHNWHATLSNSPTWTWGVNGLGRSINWGSSGYGDLPTSSTVFFLTAGKPFFLCWWEKILPASGGFPSRFRLATSGASQNSGLGVLRTDNGSYQPFCVFGPFAATGIGTAGAPSVASSVGIWNHFGFGSTDPNSSTVANWVFYVNGVSQTPASTGGGTYNNNTINRLGFDGIDSGPNCFMNDIRLYSRIPTADEVHAFCAPSTRNALKYQRGSQRWFFNKASPSAGNFIGAQFGTFG
jgi:hypothetical protein